MLNKVHAEFTKEDLITFKAACELIARCDINQAGAFVNEVLMIHPFLAWNQTTKSLDSIESVSINGDAIQLNIEEFEVGESTGLEFQHSQDGWDNGGVTFHYRLRDEGLGMTIWCDSEEEAMRILNDKSFPTGKAESLLG